MSDSSRVFISYARPDAQLAQALAAQLKAVGVDIWIDSDNLAFGEDWVQSISAGLKSADGVVIISSQRSAQSNWVLREISLAARSNVPLMPIAVDDYSHLPTDLAHTQALLIRTDNLESSVHEAARSIKDWLQRKPASKVDETFSILLAQDLAEEASRAGQEATEAAKHSVFVVHGHDSEALQSVKDYLLEIGVSPIILRDNEEPEDSLLHRFLRVAEEATFAVVVMSPDDFGASIETYHAPKGGENALRYRARQNVILELGFFLGKLKGLNKVFVLIVDPPEAWPEFEPPSDLAGVIFKRIDNEGRWQTLLRSALLKNNVEVR